MKDRQTPAERTWAGGGGTLAALLLGLASGLMILALTPGVCRAEFVGTFTKVEGRVDLLRGGARAATAVHGGDHVYVGDIVRTKSDGRTEIVFMDQTVLSIAPDTRIRIDEYTFNPDNSREEGVISLFRGKIRSVVSKVKARVLPAAVGTSTYKVKTPTTVMGVRGTDVFVFHNRGVTGVVFKEGHGFVYNASVPDRVVPVGAGQATYVRDADSPPMLPRYVSEVELAVHERDTTPLDMGTGKDDEIQASGGGQDGDDVYGYEDDGGVYGLDPLEGYLSASREGMEDHDDLEDVDDHDGGDDDALIPFTESNGATLGSAGGSSSSSSSSSSSTRNFGGESSTAFIFNGTQMGAPLGRAYTYTVAVSRATQGTWTAASSGTHTGVTIAGTGDLSLLFNDGNIAAGTVVKGSAWSGGNISGTAFGYGGEHSDDKTWISVGDIGGTFDASTYAWSISGASLETRTFLAMLRDASGHATLASLKIPFAEVGRATLAGTDGNLAVNLTDVIFFAYSTGAAPRIWSTGNVAGTYSSEPAPATTVNLTGGGLGADFTTVRWESNKWLSTVSGGGTYSGTGTLDGSPVTFEGAAAGDFGSGSFTGTAAGVVK
ncbi:MAG: FecR domain-containing protein [Thermodesulfobacteriota bacterium]